GDHYRDLIEIRLLDTSDVNWGMNSATVGSKTLESKFSILVERLKSLDLNALQAAELDNSLLADFRAICANFANFKGLQQQQQASRQADFYEPSRAGTPRSSLTPMLLELRQLELALLSSDAGYFEKE